MTPHESSVDDLALHGVRILGFASSGRVAARFGVPAEEVDDLLLDHEARGWVARSSFAGRSGWAITPSGREENERRLAAELSAAAARPVVAAAYQTFLPLNLRLTRAVTDWQIRPDRLDPMAANDHGDFAWDQRVLRSLTTIGGELRLVVGPVALLLRRFEGYADRYAAALLRVEHGQPRWLDAPDLDSVHTVWMQLHEDLIATLGILRG